MTDEAFEQAVRDYANSIFRVAYHAVRDRCEAEDVTQNVLLRLYQNPNPFESPEHMKYWLFRVAVNESRKALRAPWRKRTVPLEEWDGPAPEREETGVLEAVLALETKYRMMIAMTGNSKKTTVRRPARVALVAAALAAALCVTAAAAELPAVKEFLATVFVTVSVNGDIAADFDLPSVTVEEREGRSILVVNGEETDITDDLARKGEFLYEGDSFRVQVDENGAAIVTAYGEDGMQVTYSTELGGGGNAVYTVIADESAEGGMRVQAVGLEDGKMVSYDVMDAPAAGE